MKLFRLIPFLIILITLLLGCATTKTKKYTIINEDDVLEIMNKVEVATLDKDIEGVMKYIHPYAKIRVTFVNKSEPETIWMSREQYKNSTVEGWSMTSRYEYSRENDQITISEDKQNAVVETDVIESYMYQGQSVNTRTHERITMAIIDGKILVTEIDAFMEGLLP